MIKAETPNTKTKITEGKIKGIFFFFKKYFTKFTSRFKIYKEKDKTNTINADMVLRVVFSNVVYAYPLANIINKTKIALNDLEINFFSKNFALEADKNDSSNNLRFFMNIGNYFILTKNNCILTPF